MAALESVMQIRIAVLADYTNITNNGKLNILGIFSQIHAGSVPATHAFMNLVIQFAFEAIEASDKNVKIILQDADAKQVLSLEGILSISKPNSPDPIVINQVVPLQNIVFPHYGSYEFAIEVDGETVPAQVPVDILPVPSPTPH